MREIATIILTTLMLLLLLGSAQGAVRMELIENRIKVRAQETADSPTLKERVANAFEIDSENALEGGATWVDNQLTVDAG